MRKQTERALISLYADKHRKRFTHKDIAERVDDGYAEGRIDFPMEKRDEINSFLLQLEKEGYVVLKRDKKEQQFTLYGGTFTEKMESLCRMRGVRTRNSVREAEAAVLFLCRRSIKAPALQKWMDEERETLSFASVDNFDTAAFRAGLLFADAALCNTDTIYERDFAKKAANNTKAITGAVRSCLERILIKCADEETLEEYNERKKLLGRGTQILPLYGVIKTPQYIFTQGDMEICMDSGDVIQTHSFPYVFSSDYIGSIKSITVRSQRILTIENKTTYEDFSEPGTMKVYTGGFLSFPARELLAKIYASNPHAEYRHWSDIDGGGIRIFRHIRQYVPPVMPYRMDVSALLENKDYTTPLTQNDRKFLQKCVNDPYFSPTVRYMLKAGVKLEQESFFGG